MPTALMMNAAIKLCQAAKGQALKLWGVGLLATTVHDQ